LSSSPQAPESNSLCVLPSFSCAAPSNHIRGAAAFDRYIEWNEIRIKANRSAGRFLRLASARLESQVRAGQGKKIDVPDGMIQHWVGTMFLAGGAIPQGTSVLQDYANYKSIFRTPPASLNERWRRATGGRRHRVSVALEHILAIRQSRRSGPLTWRKHSCRR
jgi:hypothetical protein